MLLDVDRILKRAHRVRYCHDPQLPACPRPSKPSVLYETIRWQSGVMKNTAKIARCRTPPDSSKSPTSLLSYRLLLALRPRGKSPSRRTFAVFDPAANSFRCMVLMGMHWKAAQHVVCWTNKEDKVALDRAAESENL